MFAETKKVTKKNEAKKEAPTPSTSQQPAQQTTQPAKKSNTIYWVCGCLSCCGIVLLLVVLLWVLSWSGVIAPGLMPSMFGG